jgi:hypothetical protein
MSTSPVNLAQAANAQLGVNLPLAYGFNRARGNEILNQQLTTKNRVSIRILAEGEWDGIERLWINSKLVNQADTTLVHFHPGVDGTLGGGLAATSTGGDQVVDAFFSLLPANFQPETFSRKAYIALNVPPDPGAPSATLDVLGDYRCSKVRQFDASGNQTAYSFSTNGAWQILDAILRAYLKPEWNPSAAAAGGGDLTAAEKARISFPDVVAAAAACDFLLPSTGQKRFSSSVAFVNQTSLTDALTQLCNISQLFVHEAAGKIYIRADQQRNSSFILTADHIVAGKMSFDKKDLHGAKNRIICTYRDVNPQDSADIETIANSGLVRAGNVVTVKTKAVHPYLVGDSVNVLPPLDGSTHDTSFDGLQGVASVPATTTWTYAQVGANAASGNGYTGTPESRFAQRTLQVDHEQHQKSIGQRGLNLTQAFHVAPVTIDLGNSTAEQVQRTATFMKSRPLGLDQTPYLAPFAGTITAYLDAVDVNGNSLIKQLCGDILTIDATVSEEYQGDYEIKQAVYTVPPFDGSSSSANAAQSATAPTIDLTLLQYLPAAISDGVFLAQPISASVPRTGLTPLETVDGSGNKVLSIDKVSDGVSFVRTTPNEKTGAGRGFGALDGNNRLNGTFRNNPVNCNGQFTGANPLSQSGTSTTILVASSSVRFGDGVVSYSSGSVNPGSLGKWYVYADDPTFTGGTVTYQATTDPSILNGGNGRVCFGVLTTTSGGGAVGIGSGGGGAGGVKLPQ